jgi:hypothetical protein
VAAIGFVADAALTIFWIKPTIESARALLRALEWDVDLVGRTKSA